MVNQAAGDIRSRIAEEVGNRCIGSSPRDKDLYHLRLDLEGLRRFVRHVRGDLAPLHHRLDAEEVAQALLPSSRRLCFLLRHFSHVSRLPGRKVHLQCSVQHSLSSFLILMVGEAGRLLLEKALEAVAQVLELLWVSICDGPEHILACLLVGKRGQELRRVELVARQVHQFRGLVSRIRNSVLPHFLDVRLNVFFCFTNGLLYRLFEVGRVLADDDDGSLRRHLINSRMHRQEVRDDLPERLACRHFERRTQLWRGQGAVPLPHRELDGVVDIRRRLDIRVLVGK